jgi:hypothetical protein
MATIVRDLNGVTTGVFGLGTSQTVAFTATSAQSTAVGTSTRIVRLVATQPCFFAIGTNPTATTSGVYLPAGVVQYVSITGGHKVAAIQASAGGSLYVTEAV